MKAFFFFTEFKTMLREYNFAKKCANFTTIRILVGSSVLRGRGLEKGKDTKRPIDMTCPSILKKNVPIS